MPSALSLLERPSEEHVVPTLACNQGTHTVGELESDTAFADFFYDFIAPLGMLGKLIYERYKFAVRDWRLLRLSESECRAECECGKQ